MDRPALPSGGKQLQPAGSRALAPARSFLVEDEPEQQAPELNSLWRALWERRLLVLGAAAIGLALALAWSLLQTPLYRSTAMLELDPTANADLAVPAEEGQKSAFTAPSADEFLETQYGLLESKSLAREVIVDLGLAKNASEKQIDDLAGDMLGRIDVDPVSSSRLVQLSYSDQDPGHAATVVNGLANSFVTLALKRRFEAAASARSFLEQRLKEVRTDLDESERRLVDYAQANGIINTGSGEGGSDVDSLQGASLVALNAMLAEAQQRRIAAEQRYRNMSGGGSAVEVSQGTASLREEKAKLEAEYNEKSTFLKDDYPEMVRLRTRIESIDRAIASEAGTVSGSRDTSLQAEYRAAVQEEQQLQGRVNQLKGAVLNLREKSIDYNKLERELEANRSLFDSLLQRYNQIGTASGSDSPVAALVDAGAVPTAVYSPNYPFNLSLGLLLGLAIGAIAALVTHVALDRITTPDDVRKKLRLVPLGVVPRKKGDEDLAQTLSDRRSPISEAYASLVTTLHFTTAEGVPPVLVVTSSVAGEGKSTTSFVIANLLAQSGKRVLLIDGDLRKPSFIVEERSDLGLALLALGTNGGLEHHAISTNEKNLWLLPSGPPPSNPAQLLGSEAVPRVIAEARKFFDAVVIDAPPVLGLADAPLLAAMSDAVVLVVESGRTRRRLVTDAIARLRRSGTTILGVALTKYRSDAKDYGYGYYSGYGGEGARIEAHELSAGLITQAKE